jgi:N-acetylglutamate synthase-like GNAT family acetyltransferase
MQIRNSLKPGDLGSIIRLHGTLYRNEYGLDHTFEGYVAVGMGEFAKALDLTKDFVAIVEDNDEVIGSIFINGLPDQTAKLRWFLLHPKTRGAGLGKRLLTDAMNFCKERKFKSVCLWTIGELTTAAHLYRSVGFTLTEEKTVDMWGGIRKEQRYDLILE